VETTSSGSINGVGETALLEVFNFGPDALVEGWMLYRELVNPFASKASVQ
jgi:hypothetical protein